MTNNESANLYYIFGTFRLTPASRVLTRSGKPIHLTPKAFDALLIFIQRRGEVLNKDELLNLIWPDSIVDEGNLLQIVFQLRRALGEHTSEQAYIETITKRGYRFAMEVREFREGGGESERGIEAEGLCEDGQETSADSFQKIEEAQPTPGFESHITELEIISTAQATTQETRLPALRFSKPHIRTVLGGAAICLVGSALIYFFLNFNWLNLPKQQFTLAPQDLRLIKLTDNGNVGIPAISADGKYIAYVVEEGDQESIWIRQAASTNEIRIIPPADVEYVGLTFSHDGYFLYYTVYTKPVNIGSLYQVPSLGGTPRKIVTDIDSPITFSPGGERMAFVRNYPDQKESTLILANSDGTNEEKIAIRKGPEFFSVRGGPSWSPDGSLIACIVGNLSSFGPNRNVVGVRLDDGTESILTEQKWARLSHVVWTGDNGGIIAVGVPANSPGLAEQLWYISCSSREVRRLTNDLSYYHWLGEARDSGAVITTQINHLTKFWAVPGGDSSRARPIGAGKGDASDGLGVVWASSDKVFFAFKTNDATSLWRMDEDGSNRTQLTSGARMDYYPTISPDGRQMAYASRAKGEWSSIWLMTVDGNNPTQITVGQGEEHPSFSPDGKWIFYSTRWANGWNLWKVSVDGGTAIQLTTYEAVRPSVSPDGKLIACYTVDEEGIRLQITLIPVDGGPPVKRLNAPLSEQSPLQWTRDGRAITYIVTRDGVSNIWKLPIDGSPPRKITDFKTERIFHFSWSPDEQTLLCERGSISTDMVLLDFNKTELQTARQDKTAGQ